MGRKYLHHLLTDGQLDAKIDETALKLDELAGSLEAMLAERERRGGVAISIALQAPAIGFLAAGEGLAVAETEGAA